MLDKSPLQGNFIPQDCFLKVSLSESKSIRDDSEEDPVPNFVMPKANIHLPLLKSPAIISKPTKFKEPTPEMLKNTNIFEDCFLERPALGHKSAKMEAEYGLESDNLGQDLKNDAPKKLNSDRNTYWAHFVRKKFW